LNFIRDITPIAGISRETAVMVVHPSVPAKTVPEFVAYAKANPGKINMASAGIGSPSRVTGELFKMMTGEVITTETVPRRACIGSIPSDGGVEAVTGPSPSAHVSSHRFRDLTCGINKQLHHRTQRAVFHRDNPHWWRFNSQLNRQHLDRPTVGDRMHQGLGEYSEETPGRQQV
jgi:hypothetical protein